ncbi:glycine/betaine ABC transporter ATP-binding protein, partial [Streptococcus agalactiae]
LVFVTHDMKEAMRLADRICVIKEGKIVQLDRPEIIQNNPSDQFVRTLFEEEN